MTRPLKRPTLVIFDCDGVLVDSEPISNQVLADDLTRRGLAMTKQQSMALFVGSSMPGVKDTVKDMGLDLPNSWIDDIYQATFDALRGRTNAMPGVQTLLKKLTQLNIPFAVASNGSQEKMAITLTSSGLDGYFQGNRFSSKDFGPPKPDPAVFLAAAARFNVPPNSCWVVEDSRSGLTAADRARMTGFAYLPDDPDWSEPLPPFERIKSFAQLSTALG